VKTQTCLQCGFDPGTYAAGKCATIRSLQHFYKE